MSLSIFTGTVQIDNDIVKAGSYTGSITLTDGSGVIKGAIPVFITVKPTFAVAPNATLDYGVDDPSKASWTSKKIRLTVKNLRADIGQTISMISGPWPSGATFNATALPALPPLGSATIDTHFTVNNGSVANDIYTGSLTFTNNSNTSKISRATTFAKFYAVTVKTETPAHGWIMAKSDTAYSDVVFFDTFDSDSETFYF